MPSRKPAATNFPTSSPTAARAMSPAATPTPASPPKNSAGAPNSASKPCAPTPGAGSPTTPKATAKPPPGSTPSHPGRVLLRFGGGIGSVVGAPPRCEPGEHNPRPMHVPIRTRGGCSYGHGVGFDFVVGAPPRCERGRAQTLLPHPAPRTTPPPRPPLLSSGPDNPLDISKSPIQEAQCR